MSSTLLSNSYHTLKKDRVILTSISLDKYTFNNYFKEYLRQLNNELVIEKGSRFIVNRIDLTIFNKWCYTYDIKIISFSESLTLIEFQKTIFFEEAYIE